MGRTQEEVRRPSRGSAWSVERKCVVRERRCAVRGVPPRPVLPSHREEKYSVAVVEVHYRSLMPTLTQAPEPRDETRQLESPAAAEAA